MQTVLEVQHPLLCQSNRTDDIELRYLGSFIKLARCDLLRKKRKLIEEAKRRQIHWHLCTAHTSIHLRVPFREETVFSGNASGNWPAENRSVFNL